MKSILKLKHLNQKSWPWFLEEKTDKIFVCNISVYNIEQIYYI